MTFTNSLRSQGAEMVECGVRYRTWAPGKTGVDVIICNSAGEAARVVSLGKEEGGYFCARDPEGGAGDRYNYQFDGAKWPDPASRFNPIGVHGAAEVIDPTTYHWSDTLWKPPALADLVIYELHVGTFTPCGTFRAAIEKLTYLVELGVKAIEIMPVADFPGGRNWGYDGVSLYAPARVYGTPNDLRALVDAAHGHGLAVILDVVYNHLGPDGNYLGAYTREYFSPTHKTPWGDGFNFELQAVRDFFAENPGYWRREFHIDGFRLDATHAIADSSPTHFLAELAERIQSSGGFVIAEDERKEANLLRARDRGGLGLDAIWSDDFHHVVRVMATGTREGYYSVYKGNNEELAATLQQGWLLRGEKQARQELDHPSRADSMAAEQFVFCISNHDQIGNQALGLRLNHLISAPLYRAASALLCLAPYTPLFFMGQEWAASTPFLFFTDHNAELGRKVTEGRRQEFHQFAAFREPAARERIPDPQRIESFLSSKLSWDEQESELHRLTLRLYRELLRLRREVLTLGGQSRAIYAVSRPDSDRLQLSFGRVDEEQWLVLADLKGGRPWVWSFGEEPRWQLVLSTNEQRFGGNGGEPFARPEVCVFRRAPAAR